MSFGSWWNLRYNIFRLAIFWNFFAWTAFIEVEKLNVDSSVEISKLNSQFEAKGRFSIKIFYHCQFFFKVLFPLRTIVWFAVLDLKKMNEELTKVKHEYDEMKKLYESNLISQEQNDGKIVFCLENLFNCLSILPIGSFSVLLIFSYY